MTVDRTSWITWVVVAFVALSALVVSVAFLIEPDQEQQRDDQSVPVGEADDGRQGYWTTKDTTGTGTKRTENEVIVL